MTNGTCRSGVFSPRKVAVAANRPLPRGDLEMDQSGEREVDLGDFVEVDLLTEAAEAA